MPKPDRRPRFFKRLKTAVGVKIQLLQLQFIEILKLI